MPRTQCYTQVEQLLDEEIRSSRRLLTALERERDALRDGDSVLLDEAGTEKQSASSELQRLERERSDLSQAFGYGPDQAGMENLIASCDIESALKSRWIELLALWEKCQHANDVNGRVVRQRRQQVQRALDLLRGSAAENALYGPSGETAVDNTAISITTA